MKRKKGIFVSCLACALIVAAVIGICMLQAQEPRVVQAAEDCGQLQLFINFSHGTEQVNIWQNEEGVYYFFLPSGTEDCRITFGNLGDTGSITMEGQTFGAKDDINPFLDTLQSGQILETKMEMGGVLQETIRMAFLRSENISSMFIDTASGSVESIHEDRDVKEAASMRLVDSAGNRSYTGEMDYIKTRGNSTWGYEKKSYQIRLGREASLAGMPAARKWILVANVLDDTLMKNEIVYRYAERYSSVPSIRGQYVDLYINGDYLGNYYLCEKIEVGPDRMDLTDLEAATEAVNPDSRYAEASLYVSEDGRIKATQGLENPADITGGYLLEHTPAGEFESATNAFRTISGDCYNIVSPAPATVEQAEYICGLFDEMEIAMAQADGINPDTGKHFSEYLDVDSWAAKYVMEEVFHDPDATTASMYMYKECDSVDPLIHSGPMWDYDRTMGSYGTRLYAIDSARQVGNYGIYVRQLMGFDEVASLVYEKFETEMLPYVENKARADIYELSQLIQASARMNTVRWSGVHGYYVDRGANVDYLAYFLEEKAEYLQDVWLGEDNYCTVSFLDYYGNVYKTYQVKRGECFSEIPSISCYVAVFAGWYVQGENIPYISGLPILADVTYESRWIGIDILLQNGLGQLDMDLSQVDPETLENMAEVLREMQEMALEEEDSAAEEPGDGE
ncbi:MAG: CotH kinase family protein [Blautia sp.]|nr:CotH kinase family protein [Blautia sp.]